MTTKSTAIIPPDQWRDIALVKRELRHLGYGPIDWEQTTDARVTAEYTRVVQAFQKHAELTADGIVGPLTWTALRNAGKPAVDLLQPLRDAAASATGSTAERAQSNHHSGGQPHASLHHRAFVRHHSDSAGGLWHHQLQ